MKSEILAIALALGAAFLFALASVLQQRAASTVPDDEARGGRIILVLIRKPSWWAGGVSDFGGYISQAAALAVGSLLIVQPLLVTTLLFALPLGRLITKRVVYVSDWGFAILLTLSLAAFIELGNPTDGADRAPLSQWLPSLIVVGGVSVASIAAASRRRGRSRALLLAVATGLLFGLTAALTKSAVDAFDVGLAGIGTLFTSWETYVLAVAISVGFVCQQSAYQAGSLKEALPTLIVLEPVTAMALGAIVFGEALAPIHPLIWLIIAASLVGMVVATVQLSRSEAVHDPVPVG